MGGTQREPGVHLLGRTLIELKPELFPKSPLPSSCPRFGRRVCGSGFDGAVNSAGCQPSQATHRVTSPGRGRPPLGEREPGRRGPRRLAPVPRSSRPPGGARAAAPALPPRPCPAPGPRGLAGARWRPSGGSWPWLPASLHACDRRAPAPPGDRDARAASLQAAPTPIARRRPPRARQGWPLATLGKVTEAW